MGERAEEVLTKAYLASGWRPLQTADIHSGSLGVSLKRNASLLRSSSWKLQQRIPVTCLPIIITVQVILNIIMWRLTPQGRSLEGWRRMPAMGWDFPLDSGHSHCRFPKKSCWHTMRTESDSNDLTTPAKERSCRFKLRNISHTETSRRGWENYCKGQNKTGIIKPFQL